MAKIIMTVDDIDGSADARTHTFSLDGDNWEIDLSAENAAKLRDTLQPYITKARKTSSAKASKRPSPDYDGKAIREWAAANGVETPSRGRIPQRVLDAYAAR